MGVGSDVVEAVEEVFAVDFGDFYVGGVVERGEKHASVGGDHRDVGDVDDERFVGPDKLRETREDRFRGGLAAQDMMAEIVEHYFP